MCLLRLEGHSEALPLGDPDFCDKAMQGPMRVQMTQGQELGLRGQVPAVPRPAQQVS